MYALAFLLVACSSGGDNTSTPDATPFTCPAGSTDCGGSCVIVDRDPQNCGACGTACPDGQVCSQGQCGLTCLGGATKCGDTCTDIKVDSKNCGGCGAACPAGEYCSAGACGFTCGGDTTMCGDAGCFDTQSDRFNCGGCGTACEVGEDCVQSACALQCQQGLTLCPTPDAGVYPSDAGADAAFLGPNECTDIDFDPFNCGGCGTACNGSTPKCSFGTCVAADGGI